MKIKGFIFVFVLCSCAELFGQIGSRYTYEFLALPVSSRITALGSVGTSLIDEDINLAYANPALLNDAMDGVIALNHNFHFADISNGYLAFGKKIKSLNTHIGFNYANYGNFILSNEFGEQLGKFKSSERALVIGASKKLNERIRAGVNAKTIFSSFEQYQSFGLAFDASLIYQDENKNLMYTMLFKNIGGELSTYNQKSQSAPLDIQIGISKKLKYLPFRFSVVAHQLQQWSVRYDDPNENINGGIFGQDNEPSKFSKNVDNFFRHIIFNGELSIGKKGGFQLRAGYNHFRRRELSLTTLRSLAGFSLGFGLKIKQFNLDYGIGYFHLAGATNHLSIRTSLDRFKKKVDL